MTRAALGVGVIVFGVAAAAAAHPGHGLGGGSESFVHYVTDPFHVAPPALAVLALLQVWRRRERARARRR